MNIAILFVGFLIIAFLVISLLSTIAQVEKKQEVEEEVKPINADSQLVDLLQQRFFQFSYELNAKDAKKIKKYCTEQFYKSLNIKKTKSEKIMFFLSSKLVQIIDDSITIEFTYRSLNTELFKNQCIFKMKGNNPLIDQID